MKKRLKIAAALVCFACAALPAAGCGGGEELDFTYPARTDIVTDRQYYSEGEVKFPAALWQKPESEEYPVLDRDGVKAYFLDSVGGTKVFAYVGIPENASAQSKVPGMVLVHGGGGTAFSDWVKMWNDRGYAAIAMDTDGNMPNMNSNMDNNEHDSSVMPHGPANVGFADSDSPIEEQWAYHALASVVVSNSFLRSFPEVDVEKIGLTGISYGGFLSSIAPGYDDRFLFSAPVYGSVSQVGTAGIWGNIYASNDRAAELWDDIAVVEAARSPMFFVNGSNDQFFTVDATTDCMESAKYGSMLLKYHFLHGHSLGADVDEIFAYADWLSGRGKGLVHIKRSLTPENMEIELDLPKGVTVAEVYLYYTPNDVLSDNTNWFELDQTDGIDGTTLFLETPAAAKYCYANVIDSRGLEISTGVIKMD